MKRNVKGWKEKVPKKHFGPHNLEAKKNTYFLQILRFSHFSDSFKPSSFDNFVRYCYLFPNKSKIFAANLLNTGEGNKYQSKNIVQSLWILSQENPPQRIPFLNYVVRRKQAFSCLSVKVNAKCPNWWIIHKCRCHAITVFGPPHQNLYFFCALPPSEIEMPTWEKN